MLNVKDEIKELFKNGNLLKMNIQFFAGEENKDTTNEVEVEDTTNEEIDEPEEKENHEKTFTQREVNKMMAREKRQGKASVYRELGIDPKNTNLINMLKAVINSQSAKEENNNVTGDDTRLKEAEHKALIAEIKAEAMMQGVAKNYVDDVTTLVIAKLSDDTDVETLISELKTKYPVWFDIKEDDVKDTKENKEKNTGTSLSNKKNSKTGKEANGLGARLAAQKKQKTKTSYWN